MYLRIVFGVMLYFSFTASAPWRTYRRSILRMITAAYFCVLPMICFCVYCFGCEGLCTIINRCRCDRISTSAGVGCVGEIISSFSTISAVLSSQDRLMLQHVTCLCPLDASHSPTMLKMSVFILCFLFRRC